jgi:transposase
MLEYFQGSTAVWVPDNLRSAVTRAHRYEPEINRTYLELAPHYGAVVIPTRVARPQDKPNAEVRVQIAQRCVLAALRHRIFFTLADLNEAIAARIDAINAPPMKVLGSVGRRCSSRSIGRRSSRYREPATSWRSGGCADPTSIITWRSATTSTASRTHSSESLEACVTASTVEVFFKGRRVAAHARLTGGGRYATRVEHMPRAHRAHAEWTPSRLIAWADQSGPATGRFVAGMLERRPHPEQGYRACLGLMRLGREHGADRSEAACQRAEQLRSHRFRTVEHILKHQQDRLPSTNRLPVRCSCTRTCGAPPTTRRSMVTQPTIELTVATSWRSSKIAPNVGPP